MRSSMLRCACSLLVVSLLLAAGRTGGAQASADGAAGQAVEAKVTADAVPVEREEVDSHRIGTKQPIRTKSAKSQSFSDVELEIVVNSRGEVISAKPGEQAKVFGEQAVAEAMGWRYEPFERNGRAVAARFQEYIWILPPERLPTRHVAFPVVRDLSSVKMTLERTGCLGSCPGYSVEIDGDGTVVYAGRYYTAIEGEHRAQISEKSVRELLDLFRAANYYSLDADYSLGATDLPTYLTSLSIDGQQWKVVDYAGEQVGMPQAVGELEEAIDRISGDERWLRGNEETVPSLKAEKWDFKSPEAVKTFAMLAAFGNVDAVSDFIDAGVPLQGKSAGKDAPLVSAARARHAEVVKLLIEAGASRKDAAAKAKALAYAAQNGDMEMLRALLDYGADPKFGEGRREDRDIFLGSNNLEHGQSVWLAAASSGKPEIVKEILKYGLDLNERDFRGRTVLFAASDWQYRDDKNGANRGEVIRMLAAAGADVNARDKDGNTALHDTIDDDAAKALIAVGADVNARNKLGETPLMSTVSAEITKILIAAGADVTLCNKEGKTALQMDLDRNYLEAAKMISAAQGK